MIKSEIFASALRDVCEVTGISERDIMSKSKSEEIVDDPDQADGFIFNRWYADTVRSGIPVDWEGIL